MKNSVSKNILFNIGYKGLNIIFPVITSIYLAHILGPKYVGKITYAQNILSYFTVFASLGIPTYGTREIAKLISSKHDMDKVFSELFVLNAISTIICSSAYTIIINILDLFSMDRILYLCVGLTLYMNVFNVDWLFLGKEEFAYITKRSFIIKILTLILIFLCVRTKKDYVIYAFLSSLGITGNYFFNMARIRKEVHLKIKDIKIQKHIKPVFILFVTILATDLYNQIDITMIGIKIGEEAVGYYSNGVKLIRIIHSITAAIGAAILPRMCLYYKEKRYVQFEQLLFNTFQIILIIGIPTSVGLALIANKLIPVLFGTEFLPTINVVIILSPLIIIIGISYLIGSIVLTATNNEKCLMIATIIGAIVNIIFNTVLIPYLGIIGAAISSIMSEACVLIIHYRYSKKYYKKICSLRVVLSDILALSVMIIIVLMCLISIKNDILCIIFSLILGTIVYFLSLVLLKSPSIDLISKNIITHTARRILHLNQR